MHNFFSVPQVKALYGEFLPGDFFEEVGHFQFEEGVLRPYACGKRLEKPGIVLSAAFEGAEGAVSCTAPVRHVPVEAVIEDPEGEFSFRRKTCERCGCWLGDEKIPVPT